MTTKLQSCKAAKLHSKLRLDFEQNGFVGPIRVIEENAALALVAKARAELKAQNFGPIVRRNRHFDMSGIREIARSPVVVDLLTEVYTPDICLWRSHIFTGKPGRGLGWHSDYFRTFLSDPLDHLPPRNATCIP